jgi:heptosyltransferase-3
MDPDAPKVLAVRLDGAGDVLLAGPALRALAAGSRRLDLLVSPSGAPAAHLLPGVDEVLSFDAPWMGDPPPTLEPKLMVKLLACLTERAYDHVVIFTSFHQSPLPMAMLARWAGAAKVSATSEDYPGSLLDVRARRMGARRVDTGDHEGGHEVEAALRLAAEAGFAPPVGDDLRLRIKPILPPRLAIGGPYVVVHASATVASRSIGAEQARQIVQRLRDDGWWVVVTGSAGQDLVPVAARPVVSRRPAESAALAGGERVVDLVGRTSFAQLAGVLAGAECVVVGNTGPAHLAAAVGTSVVSLFSPVVPVERWGPWRVPHVVLGDQQAACRLSRARECPVAGHPCLSRVEVSAVSAAVERLTSSPSERLAVPAVSEALP